MANDRESLVHSDRITVERAPEDVYAMVSDVTRMGEWSPVCTACWWDEGDTARVGAHFTGRNERPDRVWETRCEVVTADSGREFAFVVGPSMVAWSYTFTPVNGGTEITESWEFLPAGLDYFDEKFGAESAAQIADRVESARAGIPVTLAAIKQVAEAGDAQGFTV